ncbi:DUF465 domain-containing protein [Martelella alba]|uniref:DUF465 domain-containing protein n=1 Tax=Martelella alba TaxID=2590451 RepID=A0A506UIC5_9HYPH|nr:DUF465 domain-containing protein [Martelella alba]TPW33075.1 DUF465 domain-containing protein [Martelella alba]
MPKVPHDLTEELPGFRQRMRELRQQDSRFDRLFQAYHSMNRAIFRAETKIEPADDMHMIFMRRRRMALKDEIYGMLEA